MQTAKSPNAQVFSFSQQAGPAARHCRSLSHCWVMNTWQGSTCCLQRVLTSPFWPLPWAARGSSSQSSGAERQERGAAGAPGKRQGGHVSLRSSPGEPRAADACRPPSASGATPHPVWGKFRISRGRCTKFAQEKGYGPPERGWSLRTCACDVVSRHRSRHGGVVDAVRFLCYALKDGRRSHGRARWRSQDESGGSDAVCWGDGHRPAPVARALNFA